MGRTRTHRVASVIGSADRIGKECDARISRLEGWTLIGEAEAAAPVTVKQ